MYRYIAIIYTFCVTVNGDTWNLGSFNSWVYVGNTIPPAYSTHVDIDASQFLQQNLTELTRDNFIETKGFDPIFKNEMEFGEDYIVASGSVKLTNIVATGLKSLVFEDSSVSRNFEDGSLRIDLTANIPILSTKFHFAYADRVFIFWSTTASGRANINLENVRLRIKARVNRVPRRKGSETMMYQITGLNVHVDVDNLKIKISTDDKLPMTVEEMVKKAKDKILNNVAKQAMNEVNVKLEELNIDYY